MDVTKPYEVIGFGALDVTKPYESIGFGALDVTRPYERVYQGSGRPGTTGSTRGPGVPGSLARARL